ncbi:tyrosine-protein phosphatase siw14 [Extremus antarcticus]|uniref:Tyrosine-protein phosphatase siw14 n=1 Tax=Extremus antarcticus TaxID=702011 RepID=A0AAJ0DIA1_9PEZI|nr:tyrosine-protein phosphatase siw14 [Extremus antarcticus]
MTPNEIEPEKLEERLKEVAAGAVDAEKTARKKAKKESKSGPPSPPDSGSTTPRLTIAPCPARLRPYLPPLNFGAVELHRVFRSSFPMDRNVEFLKKLHIRSLLTLVDSESTDGYHEWIRKGSIEQKLIDVAPNKDGNVATTVESICEALLFVMDSSNHPLYIHCNQGKHRTGCVVACLRKVQRVPMDEILAEYRVYSGIKARDGDIAFIKSFDPELVFEYAKTRGYLGGSSPVLKRLDSTISDIDTLAAALAAGAMADDTEDDMRWFTSAMSPASSSISDGPLEMRLTQPAILGGEDDEEVHFHPSNDKNMHGTIDQSPVVETVDVTMMGDDVESDASSDTEVYDGMVVDEAEAPPRRTTCIDPALVTMI